MLQSGLYSPRLETLQSELMSGRYQNPQDIAALQRDIQRVFTGVTGDMNARPLVATPGINGPVTTSDLKAQGESLMSGWDDWKKSLSTQWDNLFSTGTTDGSGDGWFSGITKYAGRAGIFVIGALLLVGAFLVYRK